MVKPWLKVHRLWRAETAKTPEEQPSEVHDAEFKEKKEGEDEAPKQ